MDEHLELYKLAEIKSLDMIIDNQSNEEVQQTIEGISKISLKKGKKYVIPRRTESRKLNTVSDLNLNVSNHRRGTWK